MSISLCYTTFSSKKEALEVTRTPLIPALRAFLKKRHPYECPCILDWEVKGNQAFSLWVEKTVDLSKKSTNL